MAFVMMPFCAKWCYVPDKAPSFTSRNLGTFHLYGDEVKRRCTVMCSMLDFFCFFVCFWPDNWPTCAGAALRAAPSERGWATTGTSPRVLVLAGACSTSTAWAGHAATTTRESPTTAAPAGCFGCKGCCGVLVWVDPHPRRAGTKIMRVRSTSRHKNEKVFCTDIRCGVHE